MNVYLVSGGQGFVGSALVQALHARGYAVRCLDRLPPAERLSGVEYFQGCLLDPEFLESAVRGVEAIFHTAAVNPIDNRPGEQLAVNYFGSKALMDVAVKHGIPYFCHFSSSSVYGKQTCLAGGLKEEAATDPFESYSHSKLKAEIYIAQQAGKEGAPKVSILRPRCISGPGRLGVFQLAYEWARIGFPLYIPGGGHERFQYLDIRDLVTAALAAYDRKATGIFNLGAGHFSSLREDLGYLCQYAGTSSRVKQAPDIFSFVLGLCSKFGISPLATWHLSGTQLRWYLDIGRARRELGWEPRYSNQQSLADGYDWYLKFRQQKKETAVPASNHQSLPNWGILSFTKLLGRLK